MRSLLSLVVLGLSMVSLASVPSRADVPKPNVYPLSWELKFEHALPRRIAVQAPTDRIPQAYWYITFTVTNNTDKEQQFLPVVEMVDTDGKVTRSDKNIPQAVFDAIKTKERKPLLEPLVSLAGVLRLGESQARDSVAIWPEPTPRMGKFQMFVQGLSGEFTTVKGADGKDVILRKTLQLNFFINGDEVYPGEDVVNDNPMAWVMR